MTEKIGSGLLILNANGYNQVSVSGSRIYAGGKNLPKESKRQLFELGWLYDEDFQCWIFETIAD